MSNLPSGDSKPPSTDATEAYRLDLTASNLSATEINAATGSACLPAELGGGRYVLCQEIGRGGMGLVLRVHDHTLQRDLACKVLQEQFRHRADLVRRLVDEAHIGGQLQHPGVVPVHELGALPDGRPFFTMKLIEGRTLAQLLRERRAEAPADAALTAGLPRFLQIFAQVCQTMAFAHSKGVIHRDLKPSNIMVGAFGEVQVMDWGLAKSLGQPDEGASCLSVPSDAGPDDATVLGNVVGTVSHMSPEQACGQIDRIDRRSDVFCLGAILFEILTGRPLYAGPPAAVKTQAKQGPDAVALAALVHCGADPELVALARRCLAATPADRPADAGELAAAVDAYQQAVQNRLRDAEVQRAAADARAQQAQKTAKAERRSRRLTAALAVVAVAVVSAAGVGVWWWQDQQTTRAQAERERELQAAVRRQRTQSTIDDALREAASALVQAGSLADDPDRAEAPLMAALAAGRRAESHADADDIDHDLRERVLQTLTRVRLADQERRLAAALDTIRLDRAEVKDGRFQFGTAAPRYAKAFAQHGWNLEELDASAVGARLQDTAGRERLTAALRDWWRVARDPAEKRRLGALLAAVEVQDDAFAARWRSALESGDRPALLQLVKDTHVAALSASTIQHLADDLVRHGAADAAVALLQQGQARFPADFWIHHDLGMALRAVKPPRFDLAARHLTAAVALRPRNPGAHVNLGMALFDAKDYDGAAHCFRAALAIDDGYWQAHLNLGNVFAEKKEFAAAIAKYQKAIALHENYPNAYYHMGVVRRRQKDLDGAIRAYETAIELKDDFIQAHVNLGNALFAKKEVDRAMGCFRTAIALDPGYAAAHFNLGSAHFNRREYGEALRCYRAAIAADPDYGLAYAALGQTLLNEGEFEAALSATKKAQGLLGAEHPSRPQLEKQFKRCEQMLAFDQKVMAVLRGEATAATPAEMINYALHCQLRKQCFAGAAKLYTNAFAADPALADDMRRHHRYNAACAAVRAAAGHGRDAARLTDEERHALREQAYAWLRTDLDYWSKDAVNQSDFAATRRETLEIWIFDPDLTSVRYPRALAALPSAERDRWLQFWRDVAALAERER